MSRNWPGRSRQPLGQWHPTMAHWTVEFFHTDGFRRHPVVATSETEAMLAAVARMPPDQAASINSDFEPHVKCNGRVKLLKMTYFPKTKYVWHCNGQYDIDIPLEEGELLWRAINEE